MGSKDRAIAGWGVTAFWAFCAACGPRAAPPLAQEEALVARLSTIALVEKPGPEGKVRGLAHLGEAFVPSPERATDTVVAGSESEGYPAASGSFIGLRRERSGPLYLGPEGSFAPTAVVTTDALCASLARSGSPPPPDCPVTMRRLALPDGRTLGYLPCLAAGCPVVVATHREGGPLPFVTTVDGLADGRGLATKTGFRVVFRATTIRPGQGPGTRYEIREITPGPPLRIVSTIEGSTTTTAPDGSLLVRLVQVRFGEGSAHVVGTERRAPNAGAVGETVRLDQRVPYPE